MILGALWRRLLARLTPQDPPMRTIPAVRGLELTSATFRARLCAMADRLGLPPEWIAAVISVESAGTFRADIRNPRSGFTGLIQFGPVAAAQVGTTLAQLGHMTNVEQLRYVEAFFRPVAHRIHSVDQAYLAVFAPALLDAPPLAGVYRDPTKAYVQNRELDVNQDGVISVAEATAPARLALAAGLARPPLSASAGPWPLAGALVLLAVVSLTIGKVI